MSLKSNIWWTRKAKIQNEARLLKYEFHSQILLLWYSFLSVGISILTITDNSLFSKFDIDPKLIIVFTVLSLFVSTFVISQNFKERASKVKVCYERLNNLYQIINSNNQADISEILKKYNKLLDSCENHLEKDYISAKIKEYYLTKDKSKIDKHPLILDKFFFIKNLFFYYCILFFFYSFPILTLYFSWKLSCQT